MGIVRLSLSVTRRWPGRRGLGNEVPEELDSRKGKSEDSEQLDKAWAVASLRRGAI